MIKENEAEFKKSNLNIWHNAGYKGQGITIVILDDRGVPAKHLNVITPFPDEHRETKTNHNTQVCSVARESAPLTRIISMPWMGLKKPVIDWIVEHKDEIDIINCSFAGVVGKDEFNRLKQLDIPIICASGNNASEDKISRPARYDWTIAIGAVTESNGHVAGYSNGGKELYAVAYTSIFIPSYTYGYDKVFAFGGTSCASPYACGILACYLSWRKEKGLPRLSREEIRQFIHDNAVDMYEEGHDYRSGYGLFALPKEIPEVENNPSPSPVPETPIIEENSMNLKDIMSESDYSKYINFRNIYENAIKDGNEVAVNYAKNSMIDLLNKYWLDSDDYIDDEPIPRPYPEEPIEDEPKEPIPPREEVKDLIIDISHHQLPSLIDYDKLAKQIKLAIIRTQYGSLTIDKYYKTHHAEFRKRGIPTACYAWVRGISIDDMRIEAIDFYNRTKDLNPTFWFLDVEEKSMENMRSGISEYVKMLRSLGAKKIGIYIGHHLYKDFNLNLNEVDAVWIPHYGKNNGFVNSNPLYKCDIHQYTSKGILEGYSGNLDLNRLTGTKPLQYFTSYTVDDNKIEPKKFNDIKGHWAEENINYVVDNGLMNGYEDSTFKPDKEVTRAELATVLKRIHENK